MNQSNKAQMEDGVIERAKADEIRTRPVARERRPSGLFAAGLGRLAKSFLGVGLGIALVLSIPGCHKSAQAAGSQSAVDQNGGDPADANMAQTSGGYSSGQPTQVLGARAQDQSQQQGEDYSQQQAAPIERQGPYSGQQNYDNGSANYGGDNGQLNDQQADDVYSNDLTDEQASDAPPPLPEYDQPPAPDPDDLWTPGYWAWGPEGYYWVPGGWVEAPYEGALWTPGYWGFYGGFYRFHHGYWGLHIGYYGGVDYGYGYVGHGYYGGYWNGGHFFYNTTINRVDMNRIHNVYVHPVMINNVAISGRIGNRVSFNGGRGGIVARPMAAEARVLQERRISPMTTQVQAQHAAAQNRQQLFSQNQGRPAVAVAARPITKDRTLPAALPTRAMPAAQPGNRGIAGPGQQQAPGQQIRPQGGPQGQGRNAPANNQSRPNQQNGAQPQQGQPQMRQGQPQPAQPQQTQPQPQMRQGQPQSQMRQGQPQQAQPQSQMRQGQPQQAQPQPQMRQGQPQPQSQMRQGQPQQAQPQPAQPQQTQPQPQMRQGQPQSQMRQGQPQQAQPQSQMRQGQPQQAQPQPQARQAQPQPQARPAQPQPQPQARPAQPQPQARPDPAARPQPKDEGKPR